MSDEVEFDALVEVMPWGRNVYTVVRVPEELVEAARAWPTRRVAGTVDDVAVNVGLNQAKAGVIDGSFVYVGTTMQRRLGVRAGDVVTCRLRPVDPDVVPLPDDVRDALEHAGLLAAFEARPASERRRLLVPVEGAAREETRARRIAALCAALG